MTASSMIRQSHCNCWGLQWLLATNKFSPGMTSYIIWNQGSFSLPILVNSMVWPWNDWCLLISFKWTIRKFKTMMELTLLANSPSKVERKMERIFYLFPINLSLRFWHLFSFLRFAIMHPILPKQLLVWSHLPMTWVSKESAFLFLDCSFKKSQEVPSRIASKRR